MKTLVNKNNPAIRIIAPEIVLSANKEQYWIAGIPQIPRTYLAKDWTLVEEEPTEDWKEKRKKECPFRQIFDNNLYGCKRYADVVFACDGNCSWVMDYPKLKEIQDKKKLDAEIEKELRTHYNDDQDVYWWNYLKNSFRHFYELGKKGEK